VHLVFRSPLGGLKRFEEQAVERQTDSTLIGWITMVGYLAICGLLYGMN
jgi:hypothetical protein